MGKATEVRLSFCDNIILVLIAIFYFLFLGKKGSKGLFLGPKTLFPTRKSHLFRLPEEARQ
jgi:hypothetical protein